MIKQLQEHEEKSISAEPIKKKSNLYSISGLSHVNSLIPEQPLHNNNPSPAKQWPRDSRRPRELCMHGHPPSTLHPPPRMLEPLRGPVQR